jgi:outer membrane protein OmpA-like peptidoglycan-associated protein
MSMRITLAAGACLVMAAAMSATDARAQIFYLGGEAGWSVLENESDRAPGFAPVRKRFDSGFAAGARAGYEWGPWRFEEEYAYRRTDLSGFRVGGVPAVGARGNRQAHAIMTNVLYDINLPTLGWPVTPHVGAGVGAVNVIDRARSTNFGVVSRGQDWEFGYQAIAGVRYAVTPNVALDLDYRYLATTDLSLRGPAAPAIKYKSGYDTHTLMASLVYRFGPSAPIAAPPAVPAAAPAARRVFLVFFDWDRATITAEGMGIVQQAADAYKSGAPVQLQVTGYTDASGSAGYNQRLSERRANAVADALTRLGVPRTDMIVSGRGKNDQRVPTADGAREPQNRRVEIVF